MKHVAPSNSPLNLLAATLLLGLAYLKRPTPPDTPTHKIVMVHSESGTRYVLSTATDPSNQPAAQHLDRQCATPEELCSYLDPACHTIEILPSDQTSCQELATLIADMKDFKYQITLQPKCLQC